MQSRSKCGEERSGSILRAIIGICIGNNWEVRSILYCAYANRIQGGVTAKLATSRGEGKVFMQAETIYAAAAAFHCDIITDFLHVVIT